MKKALLIIGITASSVFALNHFIIEKKPAVTAAPQGEVEDTKARMKWELSRLADPATGKIPAYMRQRELAFAATLPTDANILGKISGSSNSFVPRGPNNVAGRTRAIAIDVTDNNVMFAGSVSGGVFRTSDGGASWSKVSESNGFQGIIAIVQDQRPGHTSDWYYQTGEGYGTSASAPGAFFLGNGLYKSTDSGLTWTAITSTNSNSPQSFNSSWEIGWNLAIDNSDTIQTKLYAAVYGVVYKSFDGGATWSPAVGSAANNSYFSDVAVSTTGTVYATLSSDGSTHGIYRSQGGTTFTNILPTNFPATYDRIVIGIDPNNENVVYFFGVTPNSGKYSYYFGDEWTSLWKYEYLSGNGQGTGGTWTDLSQNLPNYGNTFNIMATQGGYDLAVKVKPGNSNVVFVAGTNIYRSTSGFTDSVSTTLVGGYQANATLPITNVLQYEYPGSHPDQHAMAFLPSNPDVMISCHDGGVSKTLDNTATPLVWSKIDNGYITSQFYTVAIDHNNTNAVIIGGLQDNGSVSTNNGNLNSPWAHTFAGDGAYCQISSSPGIIYVGQQNGTTIKLDVDVNGNTLAYSRMDPIGGADYQWVNPFALDPNDNNIMYFTAGRKLYRNSDLSAIPLNNVWDSITTNWTFFPDTLTASGEEITALAVSTIPAHRVYYGTNKRKLFRIDNANTGSPSSTLITIPTAVLPTNANISCIAVNPNDADEIMVVISNYNVYSLAFSRNGGTTWARCAGNLEQTASGTGNGPSCRWATIMPVSDGTVYMVGTSVGLFATDTLVAPATVWVQQGANTIGSNVVDMMDYRSGDGLIAVATHGNGVFSANITSIGNIATINELKPEAIIMNLYPNPASSQLNVVFEKQTVSKDSKITIVNEAGAVVKTINVSAIVSGKLTIDVSDLRNGIYYINVNSRKQKAAKSFVKI